MDLLESTSGRAPDVRRCFARTSGPTRFLTTLIVVLSGVLASGAGCRHSAQQLSLDPQAARQAAIDCLEAWKSGRSLADFRAGRPELVCGDVDWESGRSLVDYSVLSTSDDGTNLHVVVRLSLRSPQGQESQEQVKYVVGTSPVLTVFRN